MLEYVRVCMLEYVTFEPAETSLLFMSGGVRSPSSPSS
jgi:hypothetical protein